MKPTRLLIILVLVITATSSALAFDGQRKGFVLGGGLGYGPVATTSGDGFESDLQKSGLANNFLIGYAWDEHNMIVFLRDGVIFGATIDYVLGEHVYRDRFNLIQGFTGLGFYHYFGPVGHSVFLTGGIGLQDFSSLDDDYDSNDVGAGFLIGGGYEFTPHVQAYASLSFGRTGIDTIDYNHKQLLFTVSAVAF